MHFFSVCFGSTFFFFDTLLVGFGPPILAHAFLLSWRFFTYVKRMSHRRHRWMILETRQRHGGFLNLCSRLWCIGRLLSDTPPENQWLVNLKMVHPSGFRIFIFHAPPFWGFKMFVFGVVFSLFFLGGNPLQLTNGVNRSRDSKHRGVIFISYKVGTRHQSKVGAHNSTL